MPTIGIIVILICSWENWGQGSWAPYWRSYCYQVGEVGYRPSSLSQKPILLDYTAWSINSQFYVYIMYFSVSWIQPLHSTAEALMILRNIKVISCIKVLRSGYTQKNVHYSQAKVWILLLPQQLGDFAKLWYLPHLPNGNDSFYRCWGDGTSIYAQHIELLNKYYRLPSLSLFIPASVTLSLKWEL